MKAKARVVDIGGLRGEHEFLFEKGKLNVVEGSNSGGKSSVIQALTAALSIPIDCDMSPSYSYEAIRLGVKTDPSNAQEGFVHVLAKKGQVELTFDGTTLDYVVDKNGNARSCPDGDPRFMLAGVLSNRSKIIRQLRGQDERHEPDDFKWAVTELSLAKRYEEVLELLEEGRDEVTSLHEDAVRKVKANESLSKKEASLEKKLEKLEREISGLKDQYENVREIFSKIEEERKKRKTRSDRFVRESSELRDLKTMSQKEFKRAERLRKNAGAKRQEHDAIDLDMMAKTLKKGEMNAESKTAKLVEQRNALDGLLNLLVVAESSMDKKGARCPLCRNGHLTYGEVTSRVKKLREEKDELNGKIGRLNMGVQQQKRELEKRTAEKHKLHEEIDDLLSEADEIVSLVPQESSRRTTLESKLKQDKEKIEEIDQKIEGLNQQVGVGDQDAQRAYEKKGLEYRKADNELAVVRQHLFETKVEIGMHSLAPEMAVRVAESWHDFYSTLVVFTSGMAEMQRKRAAEQFNATIQDLLERLGFKEFRTVMLNQDYRLYVERFDEKKKDYVFQQVRTLSTSEQMSIALILQIALKEIYLPDVPFFLMDDVMEDFDEGRRDEIMTYLQEKARVNDWYLVSTKLVKGLSGLKVV